MAGGAEEAEKDGGEQANKRASNSTPGAKHITDEGETVEGDRQRTAVFHIYNIFQSSTAAKTCDDRDILTHEAQRALEHVHWEVNKDLLCVAKSEGIPPPNQPFPWRPLRVRFPSICLGCEGERVRERESPKSATPHSPTSHAESASFV